MRLTLIELLIFLGLFVPGAVIGFAVALVLAPDWIVCTAIGGVAAVVLLAPLIYRRFHFRPLFLPKCPHCRKRPEGYWIAESCWPREIVVCQACSGQTELWYQPGERTDFAGLPRLRLCWPWFVGIWSEL